MGEGDSGIGTGEVKLWAGREAAAFLFFLFVHIRAIYRTVRIEFSILCEGGNKPS